MMIFSGPFAPKFMPDAFVASENVGDGGPGDVVVLGGEMVRVRRERERGMTSRKVVVGRCTVVAPPKAYLLAVTVRERHHSKAAFFLQQKNAQ